MVRRSGAARCSGHLAEPAGNVHDRHAEAGQRFEFGKHLRRRAVRQDQGRSAGQGGQHGGADHCFVFGAKAHGVLPGNGLKVPQQIAGH
jgi:hypothetical protein